MVPEAWGALGPARSSSLLEDCPEGPFSLSRLASSAGACAAALGGPGQRPSGTAPSPQPLPLVASAPAGRLLCLSLHLFSECCGRSRVFNLLRYLFLPL